MTTLSIKDLTESKELDRTAMAKLSGGAGLARKGRFSLGPASIQSASPNFEDSDSNEELGNMEIQDLMSRYNQGEQLAGSVVKKKDDADLALISKI